jgi:DNA-directed RNA polymerase specialized sigma24 family protein
MNCSKKQRPLDVLDLIEANTPRDPKENYRYGDLFTLKDHSVVKDAIRKVLSEDQQVIVIYSFWKDLSIPQIANELGKSQNETQILYSSALMKIRTFCMRDKNFSRSGSLLKSVA